jgi:hypothetical protein
LFGIGFSIRRVFGRFASLLGQIPVAVLMAVRCQLSCILLLRTARKISIATYSHQIVYAKLCDRLQRAAKPQKTDSKSVGGNFMGVRPPSRNQSKVSKLNELRCFISVIPLCSFLALGGLVHVGVW